MSRLPPSQIIERARIQKAKLRLTFTDLEGITGIKKGTLNHLFNGHSPNPKLETIEKLYKFVTEEETRDTQ
jgi:transcriptional regulator with XRE-family HTH domain